MMNSRNLRILVFALLALSSMALASGCAKNVQKVQYTKWGNSFVPRGTGVDTTAQGGASQNGVVPQGPNNKLTKASAAGAYFRTFASSPNYRMVGGFHVTASQ